MPAISDATRPNQTETNPWNTPPKQLWNLVIEHSYYVNIIKIFGLILRNRVDGFQIFYNAEASMGQYLTYAEDESGFDCFEFNIDTHDIYFFLFTDRPSTGPVNCCIHRRINPEIPPKSNTM